MTRQAPATPVKASPPKAETAGHLILQRECACGQHTHGGICETCKKSSDTGGRPPLDMPSIAPRAVHDTLRTRGDALDLPVRAHMKSRLGQDFSSVRVHTDNTAADSARSVGALAYTVGQHIVFGANQYAPRTAAGRLVLAHELTHSLQQRESVAGVPQALRVGQADDAFEQQADRFAHAASTGHRIMESPIRMSDASVQRLDIVTKTLRFFGISVGTITDQELTEYLDRVAENKKCDCGFLDFLSDDMAREVINQWGVKGTGYSLDQAYKGVSSTDLKRILIQELLSGPTGGSDQRAIVRVFDKSGSQEIKDLLDPTRGLSIQAVLDDVKGENQAQLLALLAKKVPEIGGPNVKLTDKQSAEAGACTVRRAFQIHFAQQTAKTLVNKAIELLDQFAAAPAENRPVQRILDCYFKGASASDVKDIRQGFDQINQTLPKLFFACPAEPFIEFRLTDSKGKSTVFEPEEGLLARAAVEEAPTANQAAGSGGKNPPAPTAPSAAPLTVLLFPDFFEAEPDEQARIVIHEALHHAKKQGAGTKEVYRLSCGEPALRSALSNAQSYAMFAAQLAQGGLHLTFDDCPEAWKAEMVKASRTAEQWAGDAVAKVDAAISDSKTADPRLRWALRNHFHTTPEDRTVLLKIRRTLARIEAAFGGELPLECETSCDEDVVGYTGGILGISPRGGNIHLCPYWFQLDESVRAETILHEMAHRYGGTSDIAYRKGPTARQYAQLSTEDALDNADSFAQFARTLPLPVSASVPTGGGTAPPAAGGGAGSAAPAAATKQKESEKESKP